MPTEVVRVADLADVERELRRAGEILRRGGLVAFPTETVYGIAVAATLPEAVDRLYRVKRRPTSKPMTLMVADAAEVRRRCRDIPPAAEPPSSTRSSSSGSARNTPSAVTAGGSSEMFALGT